MSNVKKHMTIHQIRTIAFMMANHVDSIEMNDNVRNHLPQLDSYGIADAIMGAVSQEVFRQLSNIKENGEEIELVDYYIQSLFEELSINPEQSTTNNSQPRK